MTQQIIVYGARSIALGIYKAIRMFYPNEHILGFVVSSKKNNPSVLAGLPVIDIASFSKKYSNMEQILVLIGTPEDVHGEIIVTLKRYGFLNYICINSHKEANLMERFFCKNRIFQSLHKLTTERQMQDVQFEVDREKNGQARLIKVFMAKSHKDKELRQPCDKVEWISMIQVGAVLTNLRITELTDDTGDNISDKNVNYSELTALYWMWKNHLTSSPGEAIKGVERKYYGLFHYRRILDISDEDLLRIWKNDVDVILPFPTLHEPDIREHHARYIKEEDWNAMLKALQELYPDYYESFSEILNQPYLYNYNMIIAKREILEEYCAWLFPILQRTEELSIPKGWERSDRYIGYLGENLLTLYFLHHKDYFNIVHTGRLMLT